MEQLISEDRELLTQHVPGPENVQRINEQEEEKKAGPPSQEKDAQDPEE